MDIILLTILVLLLGVAVAILYLNLRSETKDDNENKAEEIANLNLEHQLTHSAVEFPIHLDRASNVLCTAEYGI